MRRREFIAGLGGAAAWPLVAQAQQPSMPTVGFLVSASKQGYVGPVGDIRDGIRDAGYVEGKNIAIEYRFADYQYARLPALAADLVSRQVAVIVTTGSVVSAIAAKSATATIPIVFANGSDPIKMGLVASMNRPGGNVTGVSFYNSALGPKRIEILREIVPNARLFAVLVNPDNQNALPDSQDMREAGQRIGTPVEVVNARREADLAPAFAEVARLHADALIVHIDALFQAQSQKIIALAAQNAIPTMYAPSENVEHGGLLSYGTDVRHMDHEAGVYVGRILKGAKPADLPIVQPTTFKLVINLKTAKALGLSIPESFLLLADEVIE
jgi:putative tryptophan/tyrosine transport system substrate-binding protein